MTSNYEKLPSIEISTSNEDCLVGWESILNTIKAAIENKKTILSVDFYHGVDLKNWIEILQKELNPSLLVNTRNALKSSVDIYEMVHPFVTDDQVFGKMNELTLADFFDKNSLEEAKRKIEKIESGLVIILGEGASFFGKADLTLYADLARWEIQNRMKRKEVGNFAVDNLNEKFALKYKQAYFLDWRVLDQHKVQNFASVDYFVDANNQEVPKMISAELYNLGLKKAVERPFRVVPFFDPGPWGGQWLKEVIDLDRNEVNFAWGFDCVPEENSLMFKIGDHFFELPANNLVFQKPKELLGEAVFAEFGAEFPIRFDFLDTMDGGNLSLQVHPTKAYIQEQFGMEYTQDESYYFLAAEEDAKVYLGTQNNVDAEQMIQELKKCESGNSVFDAKQFVNEIPVKKHDHILIPAGTIHCSGKNSVVLEISATPYIFTFKLWDWGRLGLDGKPRPINIDHGTKVIDWTRNEDWVKENLVNNFQVIEERPAFLEERTGLYETQFIETRRHWFSDSVDHHTQGTLQVLNLVEGDEVIVESPDNAFEPYIIHYAETFIVPAQVGAFRISPYGKSIGKKCATMKAYVREFAKN